MRHILLIASLCLVSPALSRHVARRPDGTEYSAATMERVWRVLAEFPVIDGHNDFPMAIRDLFHNDIQSVNFDHDLTQEAPWNDFYMNHCDLPRMREGQMGGQFWSAYISCEAQFSDAVQLFMEQVDIIKQLVAKYPNDLKWSVSSDDIEAAISEGRIASLIGVESGHAIGSSLAILRSLYELGVRYMTLTHSCNTPWADAAQVESGDFPARADGITQFGEKVIREMNRLGMLVDLAHVSSDVMRQVMNTTLAPVIFSHSGARSVCSNVRNVPDDVLERMPEVGGLVMVNFFTCYLSDDCRERDVTVLDVVKHINHIRKVAGVDYIGIGGDYNGVPWTPVGLEDVSKYPNVFAALIEDEEYEWTDEELAKVANQNLIRVLREVEGVRDRLAVEGSGADNTWVPRQDLGTDTACMSEVELA